MAKQELINDSRLETIITHTIVYPIERLLPAFLRPNHVTYVNSICVWAAFYFSLQISQSPQTHTFTLDNFQLRLLVAVCIFSSLILDCLDGVMARRRKQTSDLGEILDHAGDSINIQLVSSTWMLSLGVDRKIYAFSLMTVAMIYNCQIVLYRLKKTMVQPPTNGVEAEFYLVIGHIVLAMIYDHIPLEYRIWIPFMIGIGSNIVQTMDWWYLYKILRSSGSTSANLHLNFILSCIPLVLLHLYGVTTDITCTLLMGFVCLRVTGTIVLMTVTEKRRNIPLEASTGLNGLFYVIWLWEIVICSSAVLLTSVFTNALCQGFMLTMLILVLNDFSKCSPYITRVKED